MSEKKPAIIVIKTDFTQLISLIEASKNTNEKNNEKIRLA